MDIESIRRIDICSKQLGAGEHAPSHGTRKATVSQGCLQVTITRWVATAPKSATMKP